MSVRVWRYARDANAVLQAPGELIDRDHEHEVEEELEPRRRARPFVRASNRGGSYRGRSTGRWVPGALSDAGLFAMRIVGCRSKRSARN